MSNLLSLYKKKVESATRSVVTIALPDLQLLIAIEDVAKITPLPEVRMTARKVLGLAEIENQQAIILDLHYPLYGTSQPFLNQHSKHPPAATMSYAIILNSQGLQYGIAVESLPIIQSIALDRILPLAADNGLRSLPQQMQEKIIEFASDQIAPQSKLVQAPGFLVDVNRMIQKVRQWAAA